LDENYLVIIHKRSTTVQTNTFRIVDKLPGYQEHYPLPATYQVATTRVATTG
jgi:hypothetical protein